jgi:rubrerythrin
MATMEKKIITVNKEILKCSFCGYEWVPRVENPKECPNCKRRFN